MMTVNSGAAPALDRSATLPPVAVDSREASFALYRGIKNILRCDEAEVVQGIAAYVISQHRGLRLLSRLIIHSRETPVPGVIALIGWLRAFLSVRSPDRAGGCAWIARLSNERRAIETMQQSAPGLSWTELKFGLIPSAGALGWLTRNLAARRLFKLVKRLQRRHEFFKVLRAIELLGYYSRYVEIFRAGRYRL